MAKQKHELLTVEKYIALHSIVANVHSSYIYLCKLIADSYFVKISV